MESWPNMLRAALSAAIQDGKSVYQIAKESGVDQMAVSRFIDGTDIRFETANKLAPVVKVDQIRWPFHLVEMAARSPRFAIQCSWGAVENSLPVAMKRLRLKTRPSVAEAVEILKSEELIDDAAADEIRDLQAQYEASEIADREPRLSTAERFVWRAFEIVERLWSV